MPWDYQNLNPLLQIGLSCPLVVVSLVILVTVAALMREGATKSATPVEFVSSGQILAAFQNTGAAVLFVAAPARLVVAETAHRFRMGWAVARWPVQLA